MTAGERREDGWEELRREIEALPNGINAVRLRAAVLTIVDRLAAARGEPHLCAESCLHDCRDCGHEVDHTATFHAPGCGAVRGEPGPTEPELREALTVEPDTLPQPIGRVRRKWWRLGWLSSQAVARDMLGVERIALATPATPEPDPESGLREALWQCGVESGMDTDGDAGPGALIAGMGDAGFAAVMVEHVRQLRLAYDECLATPEPDQ